MSHSCIFIITILRLWRADKHWDSRTQTCPSFSTQLRFERHPSVHWLFLNMWIWGEKNCSRKCKKPIQVSTKNPARYFSSYEFAHPTLVSVCTHESLSYLSCVRGPGPGWVVWWPFVTSACAGCHYPPLWYVMSSLFLSITKKQWGNIGYLDTNKTKNPFIHERRTEALQT